MRYLHKHISRLLRSERGASLFMGLMLFLVVATVTSISLAAVTAVSGRYSQLADMDRSYYNVTSAAKLFWDEMGGGTDGGGATVMITRECDMTADNEGTMTPVADSWSANIDGTAVTADGLTLDASHATLFQIVTVQTLFPSALESETNPNTKRSYACIVTADQIPDSMDVPALSPKDPVYADAVYDPFTITPTSGESKIKTVNVTLKSSQNGDVQFVFEEPSATGETSSYRCTLTANMSVDDSAPHITDPGGNKYHVEWVTTATWKAESLSTGGGTYGG